MTSDELDDILSRLDALDDRLSDLEEKLENRPTVDSDATTANELRRALIDFFENARFRL